MVAIKLSCLKNCIHVLTLILNFIYTCFFCSLSQMNILVLGFVLKAFLTLRTNSKKTEAARLL